mmetsp:Transcript_97804/g.273801  ORF Transcript_97804/g.273801 Transcript_97804/m.273801 type:complete len:212 (+) Transcript_97804:364-999(+)
MHEKGLRHRLDVVQCARGLHHLHVAPKFQRGVFPHARVDPDEAALRPCLPGIVADEAAPTPATVEADGPELHRHGRGAHFLRLALLRGGQLRSLRAHDRRGAIGHAAERQADGERVVEDHGGVEAQHAGVHQHRGLGILIDVVVESPRCRGLVRPVRGVVVAGADRGRHRDAEEPHDEEPWHAGVPQVEGLSSDGDLAEEDEDGDDERFGA